MADEKETTAAPAAPAPPKKGWEPTGEIAESDASKALLEKFAGFAAPVKNLAKEPTVMVKKEKLVEALEYLKSDPQHLFDYLSDMTAVHYPDNDKKIMTVYHLYSTSRKDSIRVKCELDEGEACPTCVGVWPAANWMEREAFDLMGVVFEGHPDLRRILMPDEWEGHPLRKEYPLGGPQEEEIRSNKYGKPQLLPDDLEEARKIIEEGRNER